MALLLVDVLQVAIVERCDLAACIICTLKCLCVASLSNTHLRLLAARCQMLSGHKYLADVLCPSQAHHPHTVSHSLFCVA